MSGYQTFAVSSGNLGSRFARSLVARGKTVYVLSRSSSASVEGTETKVVNYDEPASLDKALAGVDVVIAAFGMAPESMANQPKLAEAAKRAGVKLFVPTEYGNPTAQATEGPLYGKKQFQDQLRALGLPFVLVFTGPWSDFSLTLPFVLNHEQKTISFVGEGTTPIGWTSRDDVAYYLARYLVETPVKDVEWSTIHLEGDRKSFRDIVAIWEKLHPGERLTVNATPVAEAQRSLAAPDAFHSPAGVFTWLLLTWDQGESPYKYGKILHYADHKPEDVETVLKTQQ